MQYLKKEIREKIITAAKAEFMEFGYANASIRNIANNADISLGNIYRYFEDKEDLYSVIVNPLFESIKSEIEDSNFFVGNSMKEICDFLLHFLMIHCDEILIVRKSDAEHHDKFFNYIVKVTTQKIQCLFDASLTEIGEKIHDELFYTAVAEGFLTTLFRVLRAEDSRELQERNAREIITFYFGHQIDRF